MSSEFSGSSCPLVAWSASMSRSPRLDMATSVPPLETAFTPLISRLGSWLPFLSTVARIALLIAGNARLSCSRTLHSESSPWRAQVHCNFKAAVRLASSCCCRATTSPTVQSTASACTHASLSSRAFAALFPAKPATAVCVPCASGSSRTAAARCPCLEDVSSGVQASRDATFTARVINDSLVSCKAASMSQVRFVIHATCSLSDRTLASGLPSLLQRSEGTKLLMCLPSISLCCMASMLSLRVPTVAPLSWTWLSSSSMRLRSRTGVHLAESACPAPLPPRSISSWRRTRALSSAN
mmetsp:Transcript_28974/g.79540  ORF Transcript_28974/g.79540 Transcript_28974/m.79540 type:complete len:297 (-) Transcript_28974:1345-2235(-)